MSEDRPADRDEERLFKLLDIHLAEYRFQVDLNWRRTQHLLALNSAMLAAGVGLLRLSPDDATPLAGVVFFAGLLLAALGRLVIETQHDYYRAAREGLERIEALLGLGELGIRTTPAMGSVYRRRITVTKALLAVFAVIFVLDAIGVVHSVWVLFS
jgi:hypothetical protein